jgi:hypothetical protein
MFKDSLYRQSVSAFFLNSTFCIVFRVCCRGSVRSVKRAITSGKYYFEYTIVLINLHVLACWLQILFLQGLFCRFVFSQQTSFTRFNGLTYFLADFEYYPGKIQSEADGFQYKNLSDITLAGFGLPAVVRQILDSRYRQRRRRESPTSTGSRKQTDPSINCQVVSGSRLPDVLAQRFSTFIVLRPF